MAWGIIFDALSGSTAGMKQLVGCAIYLAGCIPLTVMKPAPSDQSQQNEMPAPDPDTSPQFENQSI
jgi:hypothetical protein